MIPIRLAIPLVCALSPLAATSSEAPVASSEAGAARGELLARCPIDDGPGHIVLALELQGTGPHRVLLDTGSATTVLDAEFAAQLELPTTPAGSMGGAGPGSVPIEVTPQVRISIPATEEAAGLAFTETDVAVLSLRHVLGPLASRTPERGPIVGIVGGTLLTRVVAEIDRRANLLSLFAPESYRDPDGALLLPMTLEAGGFPVLEGSFVPLRRGEPRDRIGGKLLLDLGANHGLAVHWPTVQEHELVDEGDPAQSTVGAGVRLDGAVAPFRMAPAREIRIGDFALESAVIELATGPGGAPPIDNLVGFVGTDLLKGHVTVLDYSRGRLLLVPILPVR